MRKPIFYEGVEGLKGLGIPRLKCDNYALTFIRYIDTYYDTHTHTYIYRMPFYHKNPIKTILRNISLFYWISVETTSYI